MINKLYDDRYAGMVNSYFEVHVLSALVFISIFSESFFIANEVNGALLSNEELDTYS